MKCSIRNQKIRINVNEQPLMLTILFNPMVRSFFLLVLACNGKTNSTFYLITIGFDRGVCMLVSMVLLSKGFEAKEHEQIHVDACRKMLVTLLAEHSLDTISKEAKEQNEEEAFNEV